MADLLVIGYPTEAEAEAMRGRLLDLQRDSAIDLADAVIAVKQADGTVRLNQLFAPAATGAAGGAIWGALIGFLILMPVAGAALGAATGAIAGALADVGIEDAFMRGAAATLESGQAALFLQIRRMNADAVLHEVHGAGGTVLRSSYDEAKQARLRSALAALPR